MFEHKNLDEQDEEEFEREFQQNIRTRNRSHNDRVVDSRASYRKYE